MIGPAPLGLLALERFLPPYRYEQPVVSERVRRWLAEEPSSADRLLSVYQSAGVRRRASVVPIDEVFSPPDLDAVTARYREVARAAGVDLVRRALERAEIPARDVSLIVSVSCTGVMIPAVDAYVADALSLGPRLVRLPITESGCAGGVVGLARAADFLAAHPDRAGVVLSLEMASLTFQPWDRSATNVVSTAIFGDGGAAAVVVGARHPRYGETRVRLRDAESVFFPGTTHFMGFNLRNQGLQIVLDRQLAPFLRRNVRSAFDDYLGARGLTRADVARWVLHPGGRRVIEVMAEQLSLSHADVEATEHVLSEHGNMSSVTVLFVLDHVMRESPPRPGELGVLGAFGPGFGAELALLEFS